MTPTLSVAAARQPLPYRVILALVLSALTITVTIAFATQPRTALAATDIELTEVVVDKPDPGGDIVLGSKSKLSAYDDVSMLMYFEFPSRIPWLYLQDNAFGETAHIELPYYSTSTVIPKAEHVLTGLDEAVTLHSDGSALIVREYELTGTPLPSLATLAWELSFGDSDSRPRSLIKLSSGALLAVWYQQTANADNSISLGFAYRNPQGEWSSTFPVMIGNASSPITSASISMVQHPADDSIWLFCKRDSFHRIEAVHLSETPAGITVDWTEADFITDNSDGENGPESERPDLVAVADPLNNSILLAYQSYNYSFFSLDPFVKGAHITIAKIAQDGARSYHTLATYAERITRLGLVADEAKAWLAYRPIDELTLSFDELYVNSYDFAQQSWDGPIFLDTLYRDPSYDNRDEALAYGAGQADFATKMADGHIHFYRLKPVSPDANTPPLAHDQLVATEQDTPVDIELSATDADGDALSYTIVSDPAAGTLTGTAPYLTYTPAPGFTGADSFAFSANDGQADSSPATVSITVNEPPNLTPLASLSADPGSGEAPLALTLDGSASLDPDGEIVRYDWAFGDGASMPDGPATTTHSYSAAGTYLVTLNVTDNRGATDTASLNIEVLPTSNTLPVAHDQILTTEQDVPVDIELSATDADGDALSYTIVSDPASGTLTGTAPYLTYTPAPGFTGADSFAFSANDGQANSNPATVSITVNEPPNLTPLASLSADPGSGEAPLALTLNGSASLDPDGEIVRYDWDFGDGASMSDGPATTTHSYSAAGTYLVTLNVTDNRGATDTASVSIEVLPTSEPVAAPSDLSANVSGSKVNLSWTDNAGNEEGFYVERGVSDGGSIRFERIAQIGANATSFGDTLPRGDYVYRVQAFNMNIPAPFSEYSNPKTVRVRKK